MRVTIDLMKKSTQIIDLSNVINPRVGDDDLQLPLHIGYGDNLFDMRGKDVEFLSNDPNKKNIYIAGTCNTNTPGDNLYMGDLTFRFPAGTFKADGTYDPDKTMFRIVDKDTQKVISSVNVKITVMKNNIEFDFDPDKSSYDSRLETMLHDFHDKGQAMLDEIKGLNNQAKSNVSGDTATTAKEAKKQADQNAGDISDLKGEVAGARGRFANMAGREDAQDAAIIQKESIANANANYAALQQKNAQQDMAIANKAGKTELENKLAQMNLQPEAFENEAALKAKYPNGKSGIMVTIDTGHNWVWANNVWKDCGIYQAAGVTTYKLNKIISGADDLVAPYDDLDTLPANSTVSYAAPCDVKNKPTDINDNFTVHTFSNSTSNDDTHAGNGKMQALMAGDTLYWRMSWGPVYYEWQKINKRSRIIITKDQLAAPYDDLNDLPINTVVTYAVSDGVQNKPYTSASFFTVFTFGDNSIGATQLLASQNSSLYWRASWSDSKNSYYGWQDLNPVGDNVIITSNDQLKSPYDDMDTIPVNSTVTYGIDQSKLKHLPENLPNMGFTIDTRGCGKGNITGAVQTLIALSGTMYYRLAWGYPAQYQPWYKVQQDTGQTNALDYRSPSLSLFDKFAVIGDSYSAGSMELSDGTWIDSQNNQWGLMLARKYGTNYTSLAKGGASTGTFLTDTLTKLKTGEPQDVYYLILGINDSMGKDTGKKLGTPDDMHDDSSTNPGTFYGNYAKIIDAVKTKSPKAKIIMFTIMAHTEFRQDYNEAIKKIAAHYGIVVADVNQDPLFDSKYYINHMKGGHPTAPLYAAQAEALERVIQKTIADNPDYFSDAAALAE